MPLREQAYGVADFDALCEKAAVDNRLRLHTNIHKDYEDPCQRLIIAMQPGSYVTPHRHTSPAKSETFIALRGRIGVILFNDAGQILRTVEVGPNCAHQVCDIPAGVWHSAIALEKNSVFLEVKPGPYRPIAPIDIASWAPSGANSCTDNYIDFLYAQFECSDSMIPRDDSSKRTQ